MPSSINCVCPHCKAALSIPAQYAGQTGRCMHCGDAITVPLPPLEEASLPGASPDSAEHGIPVAVDAPRRTSVKRVVAIAICTTFLGGLAAYYYFMRGMSEAYERLLRSNDEFSEMVDRHTDQLERSGVLSKEQADKIRGIEYVDDDTARSLGITEEQLEEFKENARRAGEAAVRQHLRNP